MKDVKIKTAVFAAVIMAIILCTASNAMCVNVDGRQSNAEWLESELHPLKVPDTFGNDINFAYVRILTSPEDGKIFLCIGIEHGKINDPYLAGVELRVCGSEKIILNVDGTYKCSDESYLIQTASSWDIYSQNMVIEAEICSAKLCLNSGRLEIKIIDTYAKYSNLFVIDFGAAQTQSDTGRAANKITDAKTSKDAHNAYKNDKSKSGTGKNSRSTFGYKPAQSTFNNSVHQTDESLGSTPSAESVNSEVDDFSAHLSKKSDSSKKIYALIGSAATVAVTAAVVFDFVRKKALAARENKNDTDSGG